MNFATRLRETEGSHFYITPTLFIDMIKVFKSMLDVQRTKYEGLKLQYVNGVQKLTDTTESVKELQNDLEAKKPKLIVMKAETKQLASAISKEKIAMLPIKEKVEVEEAKVNIKVQEADAIRKDCDYELSKVIPIKQKAEKDLLTLTDRDMNLLKNMKKPP
jgi:dynein heavy chain